MSFNPQFQKVGDILVYHNVITEDQLQKALSEQKETNEKLGQILINQDIITEADLVINPLFKILPLARTVFETVKNIRINNIFFICLKLYLQYVLIFFLCFLFEIF